MNYDDFPRRSQAQKDAQLNASYASANARYRRAEALRDRKAQEEAERAAFEAHEHRFTNWEYVYTDDGPQADVYEYRSCKVHECDHYEFRPVRW